MPGSGGNNSKVSTRNRCKREEHLGRVLEVHRVEICADSAATSCCRLFLVLLACGMTAPARAVDFSHDVVPILRVHCGQCHTGDARQGGFSMNTRESTLAGGDSGTPGVVEGRADSSEIIARVTSTDPDYRMPSEGDPLPAEAIAVLKQWIDTKAA
jgi:hypothetical protein